MIRPIALSLAVLSALFTPADPADARGGRGGGGGGACNTCGCRGGPGYRAADGKCLGHRNITRVCGSPPTTRCRKES